MSMFIFHKNPSMQYTHKNGIFVWLSSGTMKYVTCKDEQLNIHTVYISIYIYSISIA